MTRFLSNGFYAKPGGAGVSTRTLGRFVLRALSSGSSAKLPKRAQQTIPRRHGQVCLKTAAGRKLPSIICRIGHAGSVRPKPTRPCPPRGTGYIPS